MTDQETHLCTAFAGARRIASGDRRMVAEAARAYLADHPEEIVAIYDDATGRAVDLDLRAAAAAPVGDAASREKAEAEPSRGDPAPELPSPGPRGRGRPKLGVVSREVTLLPRHWDWLQSQPGGASVALRRLVEAARKGGGDRERRRRAQDAAYRFATAMAGDAPGYEEATRALFAADGRRFAALTEAWPADVRDHVRRLAAEAFAEAAATAEA